jgi:hypothetical protein
MAVMGRPEFFARALEREELGRSCVYLLVESAGADDLPLVYVGETDDFSQRYGARKFPITFDHFLVFTNKDDRLTRAHVKWLELRMWQLLSENQGNVAVANKATPTGSRLPEADIASMNTFLRNAIFMLEALGFEFFASKSSNRKEEKADQQGLGLTVPLKGKFYTTALPRNETIKAHLDAAGDAYILLAGSAVNKVATDSLPANVRKLRDQLIATEELADEGSHFVLKNPISFAKPSPASALVKGRSSTGYGDWYRISDDRRLGEVLAST